jgi:fused-like protein
MDAYHVYECVGTGSFGKVYRGRRRFTGQFVALKVIPKSGKSLSDILVLRREVDILRLLDHENIVLLLDYFETSHDIVLVTEFAHGELLQILQDDGSLPPSVVQSIAQQLASALRYLHSKKIMHRDLKPQNVLVGSGGIVKLCDFGFARELSSTGAMLSSIKGTPLYIAPEVFAGVEYGVKADIWSLGVLLFELATGKPPFYAATLPELMRLIAVTPDSDVVFPPDVPPECADFLQLLLAKDPALRAGWPELDAHPYLRKVVEGVSLLSPQRPSLSQ